MGGRDAYRILLERPEVKRPLGTPRREWEYSIKWIFEKCDGTWCGLIWLRIGAGGGLV
jgi:hypothetical protein